MELAARENVSAKALQLLILCALRTNEVVGARWSEIDLKARVWTVPAERMKARKDHRVPLSPAALDVLAGLPREANNPFVFIGLRKGTAISSGAMARHPRTSRHRLTVAPPCLGTKRA